MATFPAVLSRLWYASQAFLLMNGTLYWVLAVSCVGRRVHWHHFQLAIADQSSLDNLI